jgi:hypothetical protein
MMKGRPRLGVICALAGIPSFLLTLSVLSNPSLRLKADALDIMIQVCVQLLGFGGVIFAVLYHEQRTMLAKHREQRENKVKIVENSFKAPIDESPKEKISDVGKKIDEHNRAMAKGADIYAFGSGAFAMGFVYVGLSLVLLLIQRLSFGTTSMAAGFMSTTSLLLSSEIALITIGIASFISAWIESLELPLEPS